MNPSQRLNPSQKKIPNNKAISSKTVFKLWRSDIFLIASDLLTPNLFGVFCKGYRFQVIWRENLVAEYQIKDQNIGEKYLVFVHTTFMLNLQIHCSEFFFLLLSVLHDTKKDEKRKFIFFLFSRRTFWRGFKVTSLWAYLNQPGMFEHKLQEVDVVEFAWFKALHEELLK